MLGLVLWGGESAGLGLFGGGGGGRCRAAGLSGISVYYLTVIHASIPLDMHKQHRAQQ